MIPDGKENEDIGANLKSANMDEVDVVKLKSYARERKRRAQTKEVENDRPHHSNEQDEDCNETFSCFNSILTAFFNTGNFARTRSILGNHSKD